MNLVLRPKDNWTDQIFSQQNVGAIGYLRNTQHFAIQILISLYYKKSCNIIKTRDHENGSTRSDLKVQPKRQRTDRDVTRHIKMAGYSE